jgi:hypothetical protein
MSVREGVRDGLAAELCANGLGDEGPTLLGSLCQFRYRLPSPTIGKSGVADYVDVGQVRDGEIGLKERRALEVSEPETTTTGRGRLGGARQDGEQRCCVGTYLEPWLSSLSSMADAVHCRFFAGHRTGTAKEIICSGHCCPS